MDGNYFLYSTLSVLQIFQKNNTIFLKTNNDESLRKDCNILLEKLTQIYCKDIRNLSAIIDDVVIATDDSRSWRKDLFIQQNYIGINKELEYKGNRTKDDKLNWNKIFECFQDFLKGLQKTANVKVKSIESCEADDLIFGYSSYLNNIGKNVIIYSGDADLKQCIGFNESTNSYTVLYQKQNKKLWIDRKTGLHLKQNKESFEVDCIKGIVSNTGSSLSVCESFDVILQKIIGGDSSDNICSIIVEQKKYATGKKKGEIYESKVSDSIIKNILKEIEYEKYGVSDLFRKEFRQKIANSTIRNFKTQNIYSVSDVENNINTNLQLVVLHKDIIPVQLYENILKWAESIVHIKTCSIRKQTDKMQLLQNMDLYDKKIQDNANSASIFKELGL
jgi:hypothetical protein